MNDKIKIQNPLELKRRYEPRLTELAFTIQNQRNDWIDARAREFFPSEIYTEVHRCHKLNSPMTQKVADFFKDSGWAICHVGLLTEFQRHGKTVARLVVELECKE